MGLRFRHYIPPWLGVRNRVEVADLLARTTGGGKIDLRSVTGARGGKEAVADHAAGSTIEAYPSRMPWTLRQGGSPPTRRSGGEAFRRRAAAPVTRRFSPMAQ